MCELRALTNSPHIKYRYAKKEVSRDARENGEVTRAEEEHIDPIDFRNRMRILDRVRRFNLGHEEDFRFVFLDTPIILPLGHPENLLIFFFHPEQPPARTRKASIRRAMLAKMSV